MLEPGSDPHLTREALGREPLGQLGGDHLHHVLAAERHVLGDEHGRPAPAHELQRERFGAAERGLREVGDGEAAEWGGGVGPRFGWGTPPPAPPVPSSLWQPTASPAVQASP